MAHALTERPYHGARCRTRRRRAKSTIEFLSLDEGWRQSPKRRNDLETPTTGVQVLFLFVAQMSTVDVSSTAVSDQDRVSATEVLTYGQWRNCVLKVTHHRSRTIKDHNAVADAAVDECNSKEADYRSTLTTLAQLYKLKDPSDFARRNVDQARKTLHDMALKELQ